MKKSEATNTFDQGLLMDLNPMVTPNNVVTNCLNGTLVTYNGNENVLQNDMGNGRVETAFLPEGYIPLGTAELGGIIYIVSYNPLKDKCQIGSFPSPERNITSNEYLTPKSSITNASFINDNTVTNTIVKLKLFTGEKITKLNPGDKFAIYSTNGGISANKDTISDVFNESPENEGEIYQDLAKTEKNQHKIDLFPKFVTIHVISIGDNGKITYLDDKLKWTNKNLDYYIQDCIELDGMKQDIDGYRNLVTSNYTVFNSKISGELALLFELKTIDSFSLAWDAEVQNAENSDDKKAIVYFNINQTSNNEKIKLYSVELTKSDFTGFKDIPNTAKAGAGCVLKYPEFISPNGNKIQVGEFVYNPNNKLTDYTWVYTVTPAMPFGKLGYLATSGTINFSEIGSGKIELDEWRYYIQDNNFYLNWGLSAYPEINKKIKQVIFTFIPFYEINSTNIITDEMHPYEEVKYPQYIVQDRVSYSGNFQEIINFNKDSKILNENIQPNCLYLVDVCVQYGKINNNNKDDKYLHNYRWLYTTKQWNDKFFTSETNFDNLKLEDLLKFNTSFDINDNIIAQTYTKYPSLSLDKKPESAYDSMGIKTITTNYNKDTKKFGSESNVDLSINIKVKDYDLFQFIQQSDNSSTNITYENTVIDKSITHSEINILSDKSSEIADQVQSSFLEDDQDFPKDFETTINSAINDNVNDTLNQKLKDSFDATIVKGEKDRQVSINVKGAIFSRINADLVLKPISIGQKIRPILSTKDDYDKLGFGSNGDLKTYFVEGHKDLGGGRPFCFKFGQRALSSDSENIQYQQSYKDYWDPDDKFTRKTYWDNTPPYEDWLNVWMKGAQCPFAILQYGVYTNQDVYFKGNNKVKLSSYYGLWVKTNNGHYMPINAFWTNGGYSKRQEISKQIKAILMQIYYVETDVKSISKYIVDNINMLDKYTETWNMKVQSTIKTPDINKVIQLFTKVPVTGKDELKPKFCTLDDLYNTCKNINDQENKPIISTSNIYYENKNQQFVAKSDTFSHTFKINMEDLYEIYENNKSTTIPAMYEISTKKEVEFGNPRNATELYVYDQGNDVQPGTFKKLSRSTSNYLYANGTIDNSNNKLILSNLSSSKSNLDICNLFMVKDGELLLDEEGLLGQMVAFEYKTKAGYGIYNGNSKYEFTLGTGYK